MAPAAGEEALLAGRQRSADLRELERADDAAAVVRMDPLGRDRVELGEVLMGRPGADLLVERIPPLAGARVGRGRQVELRERGAEVEAGTADDVRPAARISSIAACASGAYAPTDAVWESGQMPTSRSGCGERFVRIGRPS